MGEPRGASVAFASRNGKVTAFDDQVGAGTVRDEASGERWSFHCTSIAGDERTIAVDTAVSFVVAPGPTGLEAFDVSPL